MKITMFAAIFLALFSPSLRAEPVQVAITFDDLPWVWENPPTGYSNKKLIQDIVAVLAKHKIEGVFAFANAAKATNRENRKILDLWVKSGHALGNHTWSHPDLNTIPIDEYLIEIDRNDTFLASYRERYIKFFRYPFLHEGNTQEKRTAVRSYLVREGYRIAQVTIDGNDWAWYAPFARCIVRGNHEKIRWLRESYGSEARENFRAARLLSNFLFKRQIKHIALFHPNVMTVEQLDSVLTQWKADGAQFISLHDASRDPIYEIDPNVVRDSPNVFTNQVRIMRGLANPPEVLEIFRRTEKVEGLLEAACK
ncbi:MAG: polysaccharide deacetylase family protein [Proteobacteria bacterium]|nr:polysaccharide deacetylase family protein [Pseudomonadota bacterium]